MIQSMAHDASAEEISGAERYPPDGSLPGSPKKIDALYRLL